MLTGRVLGRAINQQQTPMFAAQTRAGCLHDIVSTRYRHVTSPVQFFDPFDAVARARSRSPRRPLDHPFLETTSPPDSPPDSPNTLHFPSSPPPGPTTTTSASPTSSPDSSPINLQTDSGLTDECVVPVIDECFVHGGGVQRQNLNSHGTHSVPAQVIATLYSSSFSDRENVVAEGQEIAEIYYRHFPDAWYSMPENAIADADAAAAAIARSTVAIASNTAAGLPNTIAGLPNTIASTDDTIADNCDDESDLGNDEDDPVADNCDDESNLDESYDATYDDAAGNEHFHSRQRARDERPIARSRAWMRNQFLAEAADSIPLRSLPPLPPFIPFTTRLVRRRRSI